MNQKGMSLVQVMVAVGLLSVVSLGVSQLMVNMQRGVKSAALKVDMNAFQTEITTSISSKEYCEDALKGQPFNAKKAKSKTGMPITIKGFDGTNYTSGSKVPGSDLIVDKVYIADATGPTVLSSGKQKYIGRLMIQYKLDPNSSIVGGNTYKPRHVGTIYFLVNGGSIESCSGDKAGVDPQKACEQIGGTFVTSTQSCQTYKPCGSDTHGELTRYSVSCSGRKPSPSSFNYTTRKNTGGTRSTTRHTCQGVREDKKSGTKQCIDGSYNIISQASCTWECSGFRSSTTTWSCFIADTMITMSDGSKKPIYKIDAGDKVLGMNGVINTVKELEIVRLSDRKLFSINDSRPFVTAEHPFMTTTGWRSLDPQATVAEHGFKVDGVLDVGHTLLTEQGKVKIRSIVGYSDNPEMRVYNLILEGNNTYFADDFLVHNKDVK